MICSRFTLPSCSYSRTNASGSQLLLHLQERKEEGEYLIVRTEVGIARVYLNPFMDIPLLDFPLPDGDILTFLLESIVLPQEGEVLQDLRVKKLLINHLDCLTKPTEAKQRQRTTTIKAKAASHAQDDLVFAALAKQVWEHDGVPLMQAAVENPAAPNSSSSTTSAATSGLNTKQASNYSLVFDKRTNPDEWELVRKAAYAIGKWFGDDLALVCLGAFLELRERRESELLKFLGFLPTTTAADKEYFASSGFPDIPDITAKKEKKELKTRLNQLHARHILRSRHMADRENIIIWSIDLLNLFNSAVYRMDKLRARILDSISALKTDLMYCPHCNSKYAAHHIQSLQRKVDHYLCNPPCNMILQMIDTQDLMEKYTNYQRKVPQFTPLADLLSNFRNRDQPRTQSTKKSGGTSTSSAPARTSAGVRGKSMTGRPSGAGSTGPHTHAFGSFARYEPPSFMAALVNTQSAEHHRIQESEQEPFDVHPISFGDPRMEDYRVFIPVIDDHKKSEHEVGFRCAKLLLDNIADFLHMTKLEGYSHYHYCYNISLQSLFIAHKRGFRPMEILRYLNILSSGVPPCIMDRVMNSDNYKNYYPAAMVLVNCRYFIRSDNLEIIKTVQGISGLRSMFVPPGDIIKTEDSALGEIFYWLEVERQKRSLVKEKAFEHGIPIVDEYSFVSQTSSLESEIEAPANVIRMRKVPVVLTMNTIVRDYQSMSCSKLYWDSFRCHSGILILPCGAGKTLIGITAFATLQQPCIIFCQSTLAATQWTEQIKLWTNLSKAAVSAITSMHKDRNPDAEVVVTTYAMFAGNELKRKDESMRIIERIRKREWGLMILDEVHQAPADTFRRVTGDLICHLKLGLTATLVREDQKVAMLPSLVGPTLYELDVSTLRKRDHIAPIECHEIRLPFTPFWKKHYLHPSAETWASTKSPPSVVKELLFTTNPNKMIACMALITKHIAAKHKIVIFCDDLIGLDCYASTLSSHHPTKICPMIQGKTPEMEKEELVKKFRDAPGGDWLLFSKVGDMSIDLPEARVLIQIAASQGSRMQEGQRVGRIQRRFPGKQIAYAYSLVSGESSSELGFSYRRRRYLEDHGYSVQIHEMEEAPTFMGTAKLKAETESGLIELIRRKLIERTHSRTAEGKSKLKEERMARKQAGFKRQHKNITAVPQTALSPAADFSMMKALKKAKRH